MTANNELTSELRSDFAGWASSTLLPAYGPTTDMPYHTATISPQDPEKIEHSEYDLRRIEVPLRFTFLSDKAETQLHWHKLASHDALDRALEELRASEENSEQGGAVSKPHLSDEQKAVYKPSDKLIRWLDALKNAQEFNGDDLFSSAHIEFDKEFASEGSGEVPHSISCTGKLVFEDFDVGQLRTHMNEKVQEAADSYLPSLQGLLGVFPELRLTENEPEFDFPDDYTAPRGVEFASQSTERLVAPVVEQINNLFKKKTGNCPLKVVQSGNATNCAVQCDLSQFSASISDGIVREFIQQKFEAAGWKDGQGYDAPSIQQDSEGGWMVTIKLITGNPQNVTLQQGLRVQPQAVVQNFDKLCHAFKGYFGNQEEAGYCNVFEKTDQESGVQSKTMVLAFKPAETAKVLGAAFGQSRMK